MLPKKYGANSRTMTSLPDAAGAVKAWLTGECPDEMLANILSANNIDLNAKIGDKYSVTASNYWRSMINSQIPRLSLEQLVYAYYAGIITDAEWEKHYKKTSFLKDQSDILYDILYAKFDPGIILPLGSNTVTE